MVRPVFPPHTVFSRPRKSVSPDGPNRPFRAIRVVQGDNMHDNVTIAFDSFQFETPSYRDGTALAVWAVAMTMLVGSVAVAGVALAALRLRMLRGF